MMIKEPINPDNLAAYFPKDPTRMAITGPVDGSAPDCNVVLYDTAEEAEAACDNYNREHRGLQA